MEKIKKIDKKMEEKSLKKCENFRKRIKKQGQKIKWIQKDKNWMINGELIEKIMEKIWSSITIQHAKKMTTKSIKNDKKEHWKITKKIQNAQINEKNSECLKSVKFFLLQINQELIQISKNWQ